MSTAQILYEQYKVLPKKIQKELKELIIKDEEEMVEISLPAFKAAVREVKLLKEGKAKTSNARKFLADLQKEISQ